MGAEVFEVESGGKDLNEAFTRAVDNATYDWGHSGYTGTIAEKPGVYLIPTPAGVLAREVKRTVEDAQGFDYKEDWAEGEKVAEAFAQVVKWYGEDEASKIVKKSDDKWDDAIAIELTDEDIIPKDGERWFLFFGWASS